ncbi:MAG: cation-transporting P-type ATPase [Balneolaceae bacterium]
MAGINKDDRKSGNAWHTLSVDSTLEKLSSGDGGLSDEEVRDRLDRAGANRLPESEDRSALKRFLLQFHNVLIYVLIGAAVITALLEHWIDTWMILAVVMINALIGFFQEGKAEKALESIREMLSLSAKVIRNSRQQEIDAEELVPGDVVLLESGDRIPADLRLMDIHNMRVEESALTGESVAVDKQVDPVDADVVPADRRNMAFSGTTVVQGRAKAMVVETGANTELGKINRMMEDVEELTTPLLRQVNSFGKTLSVVILILAALFFTVGTVFHDYEVVDLFLAVVSLAVAAIPQGLPAIMSITLAIGVQSMARRNAVIRRLPSVETLGSVSVILSDKTGTLTKNEMTARAVATADATYEIEGSGYNPEGNIMKNGQPVDAGGEPLLEELVKTVMACNDARIYQQDGKWEMSGDPTEGALVTLGYKAGFDSYESDRIDQIPFESEHQYMATLNKENGDRYIFMKGAPERLTELCSRQRTVGGDTDMDPSYWEKMMDQQAEQGRRLIAAAIKKADDKTSEINHENVGSDMVFLGLVGIIDPARPEAVEAIRSCQDAGINVKMVTGDHLVTAKAIGLQLNIGNGKKAISGSEVEKMDDGELRRAAADNDIFARASPEHKLRLVKSLQADGKICAMTGDGVNDAPGLKRADVGVAMGIKGTEVTKDASEMVLADDNFASVANAVEEGRTIYDNLRKAILFILPTNGAESIVIMAAVLAGMTLPITPVQILWVNMVTAVTLALSLSFEPSESDVMSRQPRNPDSPILGGFFIWRITFVSTLIGGLTLGVYMWLGESSYDIETLRTIAVNILVAGQLFYLFNCRQLKGPAFGRNFFRNRVAFGAVGVLVALQLIFTYAPFMNRWLETGPIDLFDWMYPLAGGLIVFCLVELEKWIIASDSGFFS